METYVSLIAGAGQQGSHEAAGDTTGTKSQTMHAFTVEDMEKMQSLAQSES